MMRLIGGVVENSDVSEGTYLANDILDRFFVAAFCNAGRTQQYLLLGG